MKQILELIRSSQSIVLSTHRQPDGDGIGCQVALYWALKKAGKKVRILNVDKLPKKYQFLNDQNIIQSTDGAYSSLGGADLALVFDTNDKELLGELWNLLTQNCKKVVFVDHHPGLERTPVPAGSYIDISASSTGQVVFGIIQELGIALDATIARALYTSIVFDTNNFRHIRNSPTPHLITAELLKFDFNAQDVYRKLFGNYSPAKLQFLAQMLSSVEYEFDGKLAWIRVKRDDMQSLGIDLDETRDIVDLLMNIDTLEAAALFREDAKDYFKVSFRSKGKFAVNELAVKLGGGGHKFAAGAYVQSPFENLHRSVMDYFREMLEKTA